MSSCNRKCPDVVEVTRHERSGALVATKGHQSLSWFLPLFIHLGVCGMHACGYAYSRVLGNYMCGGCICPCVCMWRPDVNAECLFELLFTWFTVTGSLTESGAPRFS